MSPTRREFCQGCCALLASAALTQGRAAEPEGPSKVLTKETRAGLKAGTVKDYRKEGRFFLVADAKGIYAVTAVCTHLGCTVFQGDEGGFECPCHGSEYDREGHVTHGPAQKDLRHLPVRESAPGGPLEVDLKATAMAGDRLA